MTDWFRSWHGAPTDPKWLGIAKRAGVAPGIAVAVGWALMDRASQCSDRGSVAGYDADGLACFFGCEADQVDAIVQAMRDKGMLEGERFAAWERRQPKREDDSSQRVKAHRERTVTHGNASDALPSVSVSPSVDSTPPSQKEAVPRARRKAPSMPLPEDWHPTEASRQRARSLGFSETRIDDIAEDLRVWANGKGEIRADWDATFDGFVRRDAKEKRGTGPPGKPRSQNGFAAYAIDLARQDHDEPTDESHVPVSGRSAGGFPARNGPEEPGLLDTGQPGPAGRTHAGDHRG